MLVRISCSVLDIFRFSLFLGLVLMGVIIEVIKVIYLWLIVF